MPGPRSLPGCGYTRGVGGYTRGVDIPEGRVHQLHLLEGTPPGRYTPFLEGTPPEGTPCADIQW